jgi:HJR/Mrr/RecB family endonuclease
MTPTQEPRRGAYGTTSLTSVQVLEILSKWRPPEKHWSRLALYLILIPTNVVLGYTYVEPLALFDASIHLLGGFAVLLLPLTALISGCIYFAPAHLFVWWFDEQRKKKWISAKRKQNITAWETELDAVRRYEHDLALYQQTYTEQGSDYWLNAKGVDLENKLQQMLNRIGADMKSTSVSGDGGVDLRGKYRGEMTLIQCKGLAKNCGVAVIRDAAGVKSISGSQMVVCCPKGFTKGAINYANTAGIELWDVNDLVEIAITTPPTVLTSLSP